MSKPTDSAPAYDDLFHNHPVNQTSPSGSSSAYLTVSQDDDTYLSTLEAQAHSHTPLQNLSGNPYHSQEHVHCETCDSLQQRRERHQHEKKICSIVALTFIMFFICVMIVGTVSVDGWFKFKSHY